MALCKRRPNSDIFIYHRNDKLEFAFEAKEKPSSCLMSEEERIALTPTVGKTVGNIMQRTKCEIYRKLSDGTYEVLPQDLELPPGKYYLPA